MLLGITTAAGLLDFSRVCGALTAVWMRLAPVQQQGRRHTADDKRVPWLAT